MKRGLSSVYGFIVIYLMTVAALEASSAMVGSLVSLQASHDRADQLDSVQKIEHLTLGFSNGTLTMTNDGLVPSTVMYLHVTSATTSSDLSLNQRIQVGKAFRLAVTTQGAISAVTSLGNVFSVSPAAAVSGSGKYSIVFDATGVSLGAGQILTVDGTSHPFSDLPLSFDWASGEVHSYSYLLAIPAAGSGARVGWSDTRGLATSRTGQIVVKQSGQVVADYLTQYYLTVVGGGRIVTTPPSPTNDNWFVSATTIYVTTDYVWNLINNQSRSDLVSWSVDGATPAQVTRSAAGTFTTGAVVMNSPHTINFNSITQYHLSLHAAVSQTGGVPGLAVGYQYTAQTTVSQALSNPGFETGSLPPWSVSCGAGTAFASSAVVHSGSYSAYTDYPNDSGTCVIAQGFSAPSGGSIVSASGSVYVYPTGNGLTWMSDSCGGFFGVFASAQSSWQQLSKSDACPSNTTYITFFFGVQGGCAAKCSPGSAYWDDASFSYTYSMQYTGTTATTANTFQLNGLAVTYQYLASYSFPSGSTGRQIQFTLPPSESLSRISVGGGPSALSSLQYAVSGNTISIPDSTIATYGNVYTIVATSSGSYALSSSGSQMGDNWYDAGSVASISASATGAIVFSSWSGSPAIANPASLQTTVVMNSYYDLVASFSVGP